MPNQDQDRLYQHFTKEEMIAHLEANYSSLDHTHHFEDLEFPTALFTGDVGGIIISSGLIVRVSPP